LQKAASEQVVRNKMHLEDDFLSELEDYERMIEEAKREVEKRLKKQKKKENKKRKFGRK
jgi:hypothetical protein